MKGFGDDFHILIYMYIYNISFVAWDRICHWISERNSGRSGIPPLFGSPKLLEPYNSKNIINLYIHKQEKLGNLKR